MKFTSAVMNFFAILFATILFTTSNAAATPVSVQKRDVFVPPITYPTNTTVWNKGETHNVTWDTSSAPTQITNQKGRIMLRSGDLTTPLVLADGFDILAGTYEVTVPWVVTAKDYSLVLFGDSGNFSPKFTINGLNQ